MATTRTVAPMASFFKFTHKGQMIAGKVDKYFTTENGPSIVLRPALLRDSRGGPTEAYDGAALGLSTDLKLKINERDFGKYLRISYTDTEPTKKGSPRKIFTVEELSRDEMAAMAQEANMSRRNEQYSGRAGSGVDSTANEANDDEEELPF